MRARKRIAVLGAGAMGCLYAALLAPHAEVRLVDAWAEQVDAIRARGLMLTGLSGELRPVIEAYHSSETERLEAWADIVIALVGSGQSAGVAPLAARLLAETGYLVTLQNGIGNIEAYEAVLGSGRVVPGLSYHSAAIRDLALVEHTHRGPTWLGEVDGSASQRLAQLVELLEAAGALPEPVDNIMGWVWTKFIHNCAINAVCAVAGLRVGEIPTTPGAEELQTRIIEECLAVVEAKGAMLADSTPLQSIRAFCRLKFNKPSMLQHIEANRATEIESLNGAAVRLGAELGIPTPYNEAITWMVRSIEHHRMFSAAHPYFDYAAMEKAAKAAAR
jgi:2-dehydropantoate 2-reductase